MSIEQLILLQSEMRHVEKSAPLAYFMLLGGHLGLHRFYLRRFGTGAVQLALFLIAVLAYYVFAVVLALADDEWTGGVVAAAVVSGAAGLALFVWLVVDMCILNRMVKEWNAQREAEILAQLLK